MVLAPLFHNQCLKGFWKFLMENVCGMQSRETFLIFVFTCVVSGLLAFCYIHFMWVIPSRHLLAGLHQVTSSCPEKKQMLSISALCLQDSLAVQVHTLDIDRPHPLCPDCVHHLPLDYLSPNLFLRTLGLGCHCHHLVSPSLSTICCNGCGCEGSQVGFNFTISLFVSNGLS